MGGWQILRQVVRNTANLISVGVSKLLLLLLLVDERGGACRREPLLLQMADLRSAQY